MIVEKASVEGKVPGKKKFGGEKFGEEKVTGEKQLTEVVCLSAEEVYAGQKALHIPFQRYMQGFLNPKEFLKKKGANPKITAFNDLKKPAAKLNEKRRLFSGDWREGEHGGEDGEEAVSTVKDTKVIFELPGFSSYQELAVIVDVFDE